MNPARPTALIFCLPVKQLRILKKVSKMPLMERLNQPNNFLL